MQRVREQIECFEKEILGQGIIVAVLDTGCERHPDVMGCILEFKDFVNHRRLLYDDNGHGTHVCGIISGNGASSGGRYRGMAPKAGLIVCKVLDHHGNGTAEHMLEALQWILEQKDKLRVQVLNISIGIADLKDKAKEEELRKVLERMWECGITVVCSAGNKGPANNSISSVGGIRKVITVGCHDGKHFADNPQRCAVYSGRGEAGVWLRKPDIVAPGTDIVSCNAFYKKSFGFGGNAYLKKSGTSMATPIVSGAAALFFSKFPNQSNVDFRQKLTLTATDLGEAWNVQGWGMINVKRLLE